MNEGVLIPVDNSQTGMELLTCRVGEQWLGVQVRHVREVVTPHAYTKMPLSAAAVMGLINLRGKVITQLDVRQVVGLPKRESENEYRVAIVETTSGEDFGLVVDEVSEVIELDANCFEKTPKTLNHVWQEVSEGVLKQGDRVLVLINVDHFIALTVPSADISTENKVLH